FAERDDAPPGHSIVPAPGDHVGRHPRHLRTAVDVAFSRCRGASPSPLPWEHPKGIAGRGGRVPPPTPVIKPTSLPPKWILRDGFRADLESRLGTVFSPELMRRSEF